MWKTLILLLVLSLASSAEVKIEKVAWEGWPNCYRVSNGTVELIVTSDIGPRVMRYGFVGGQNLFKEYEDQLGKTAEKEYQLRGGHRLWVAPEELGTTWALDNGPVKVTVKGDVLEVVQPVDSAGLRKSITIKLAPTGSAVELVHTITNTTPWSVEFSPWTLTMMAQGGRAITGFPPRGKHPEVLLPTNPLVMWAYTDLSDARWSFTKKYLTLIQDSDNDVPQKVGLFNEKTWAGYLLNGELFLKKTSAIPGQRYPDFGCSFEIFTNNEMLELETLGPFVSVPSQGSVDHTESWSLHRNVSVPAWTDDALDRVLLPLLQ